MNQLINAFKSKNIACGYLYFYVHFAIEVACFYFLSTVTKGSPIIWLVPFVYDGLAFVPQSVVGYFNDKHPKINLSIIGTILTIMSFAIYFCTNLNVFISLVILCMGNALIHVGGAENTLKNSYGKLSHSAIFVAGGSFGVITGKILAQMAVPFWSIMLLMLTTIPFILLADTYNSESSNCKNFNYANKKLSPMLIVFLAVFVVIVRGYVGYGIPTSWNKTLIQHVALFFIMGFGKALGGILSDAYGIRKVAFLSTVLAIPFLCFGDNLMFISLIGVMFFSMTMSITLAILTSVLKKTPGLAFGLTTIGLFLGTAPIFFIKISEISINIGLIVLMSLLCTVILLKILDKEGTK